MIEKYFTMQETMRQLKVSRQTIYVWLAKGTAPEHVHMLGRYLFDRKDVERIKNQRAS